MENMKKKYDKIDYSEVIEIGKYNKEILNDRRRYRNNEIDIFKRFENYISTKEYSYKKIIHEDGCVSEINKKIDLELVIFNFINDHIFNYCIENEIISEKYEEYFLEYIKEQIFLKLKLQNKEKLKSKSSEFEKIGRKYLEKYYNKNYGWDPDYYRKKYWDFINRKKENDCFKQLMIFPEIIHFLTMHNYKYSDECKYINQSFYNIIKDATTKTEREYSLKDLLKFYDELEKIINSCRDNEFFYTKLSVFDRIFKGIRLGYLFITMNERKENLTNRKIIALSLALQIKDLKLSVKYIEEIIEKKPKLSKIIKEVSLYNEVYILIDKFIDIMLKSLENYAYKYDGYKININKNIDSLQDLFLITEKEENIFVKLMNLERFYREKKFDHKLNLKFGQLKFYKDIENYKFIKITEMEKILNK